MHIFFFFNDTATTEIYTLSLHDALPILPPQLVEVGAALLQPRAACNSGSLIRRLWTTRLVARPIVYLGLRRSEEHTSELQSRQYLVCRLLLEKKKQPNHTQNLVATQYQR